MVAVWCGGDGGKLNALINPTRKEQWFELCGRSVFVEDTPPTTAVYNLIIINLSIIPKEITN